LAAKIQTRFKKESKKKKEKEIIHEKIKRKFLIEARRRGENHKGFGKKEKKKSFFLFEKPVPFFNIKLVPFFLKSKIDSLFLLTTCYTINTAPFSTATTRKLSLKKVNLLTRELSRLMAGNGDKEGMGILSIFQLAYLDLERELGVTWHQYDQFKSILTTRLITPGAQQQSFDAADVKQVVANAEKTVEVLEKADTKFSEAYVALRNHAAELESSLSFESTDFYLNLRYVDFFSLQKFANLSFFYSKGKIPKPSKPR